MSYELTPITTVPVAGRYATRADMEGECGIPSVGKWADLSGDGDAEEIAAQIKKALDWADDYIDSRMGPAGFVVPLTGMSSASSTVIRQVATKLSVVQLYRHRGARDEDPIADQMAIKQEWADDELRRLRMPGRFTAAKGRSNVPSAPVVAVPGPDGCLTAGANEAQIF